MKLPPILIVSCDKYSSLWPVIDDCYKEFWPNAERIYLLTERKHASVNFLTELRVADFLEQPGDWSTNLISALDHIREEEVILLLDDFIIYKPVSEALLQESLNYFSNLPNCVCLRLAPKPSGTSLTYIKKVKEHRIGKEYRVSTQIAIWKKSYLRSLLKEGESPWHFENLATIRSGELKGCVYTLSSKSAIPVHYFNSVIRGKLTLEALRFLWTKPNKYEISFPIMTYWENYYWLKAGKIQRHLIDFLRHRFNILR